MTTYTVTVYVAAPGTPLAKEPGQTSTPGHMYYVTSDGKRRDSFGFAPIEQGSIHGPGKRFKDDEENYQNPRYSRTMEVSEQQYNRLNDFGSNPVKYGFDMGYGITNNCVGYTWKALNEAGIKSRVSVFGLDENGRVYRASREVDGKGALRPNQNVDSLRTIVDPVSNSPYNSERFNPLPKMGPVQWMLSENEKVERPVGEVNAVTKNSSRDDMFDALVAASKTNDTDAMRAVGKAFNDSNAGQALYAQGRELNEQVKAQEQQAALDVQQSQQVALNSLVSRGPTMRR